MEGPSDDDPVAGAAQGQGEGLVAVGGPPDREAAEVGAPHPGRPALRLGEQAAGQRHRVEPGMERHVADDDVADEVGAVLVPRDRERPALPFPEPEPGVEERRVAAQATRVSGHRCRLHTRSWRPL